MSCIAPGFCTRENIANIWVGMLPLLVVATGQTVVMIAAGIDLSVTSVIAMASVAAAVIANRTNGWLAEDSWSSTVALLVMLGIGLFVGGFNGGCVAWLKLPPFIITLTTKMAVSGAAIWWTQGASISDLPEGFLVFGKNPWIASLIAIGFALFVHWLLTGTLYGLRLRAVGHNPKTARVSGVPVEWTTWLAYLLSGFCAAVASIIITGQLETGSPIQWENNLLDVIGATVIGGTSLFGGRGSVLWTACGVLLLTMIDNSLNLLNLSQFMIMMTKGGVILLAAWLDTFRSRLSGEDA
jgi:ribose/xylose/arabinose/galactoside ABC-type transport system permease subunit